MNDNRIEFIRERLTPCGLHCGRCFAFASGQSHLLSSRLQAALGNFGGMPPGLWSCSTTPSSPVTRNSGQSWPIWRRVRVAGAAKKNASSLLRAAFVRAQRSGRWTSASSVRTSPATGRGSTSICVAGMW